MFCVMRRLFKRASTPSFFTAVIIAVAAVSFPAGSVSAQNDGFVLDRFDPAPTIEDGFMLQMPDTLGHLRWSVQLFLDYAHSPFVLRDTQTGDEVGDIVGNRLGGHLFAALGLGERFEVYAALPAVLFQDGDDDFDLGGGFDDATVGGVGQPEVGGSVRALGDNGMATEEFKLGVAASISLPVGSEGAFASDGGVGLRGKVLMSRPFFEGLLIPVANLGLSYRPRNEFEGTKLGSEVLYGAGLHSLLVDQKLRIMGEFSGVTGMRKGEFFSRLSTPAELMFGARYTFEMGLAVGAGASFGFTEAVGDPNFRTVLNIGYAPPRPEEAQERRDEGPKDSDGDGILDPDDECPNDPEDFDGFEDEDGCPDPDNDQDGFLDPDDACPNRPETRNGYQDDDGCPDKLPRVTVEEGQLTMPEPIEFELNRAVILPESYPVLGQVVGVLEEHPDIQLLSIEGHASDEGTERYNLILSRRRAAAVVEWLVDHGIEKWRLQSRGYGKTRPLYPNDTEEHRHLNRRVEFIILERSTDTPKSAKAKKAASATEGSDTEQASQEKKAQSADQKAETEAKIDASGDVKGKKDSKKPAKPESGKSSPKDPVSGK